jgi:NAD(P)-dependent dehydrogenase (short-subunit alcohol dehydrogenase family)
LSRALLITGASTGIGFSTAIEAARAGFHVYAGVRSDRDAQQLREHTGVTPLTVDVTQPQTLAAAAERVAAEGVPLAGIVCNAGIAIGGPAESVPLDEWRRQFDVNCVGAIATVQAFAPLLRASHGHIVLVGSVSGRVAFPYLAPYSASKFALRAIADSLRVEFAPANVAVSLIEPGSVKTPIWAKGRAMGAELRARLTPEMPAYYARAVDALVNGLEHEERTGMPVERVVSSILLALTRRRPPARRIVGAAAKAATLIGLLPVRLRDRILRGSMRLP